MCEPGGVLGGRLAGARRRLQNARCPLSGHCGSTPPPSDRSIHSIAALETDAILLNLPNARFILFAMKKSKLSKAAQELARKSVAARKQAWGEEEFVRRMRAWGKKGGRPKGSGMKKAKKGGK